MIHNNWQLFIQHCTFSYYCTVTCMWQRDSLCHVHVTVLQLYLKLVTLKSYSLATCTCIQLDNSTIYSQLEHVMNVKGISIMVLIVVSCWFMIICACMTSIIWFWFLLKYGRLGIICHHNHHTNNQNSTPYSYNISLSISWGCEGEGSYRVYIV